MAHRIDFEPVGRRGQCRSNESLLVCARQLGIGISSICGGQGTCHTCKVQILSGAVSEPTPNEKDTCFSQELKEGWRLACQTYPTGDCKLNVPPESMTTTQRIQVEGLEMPVRLEPPVQAYHLELAQPSLSHPEADIDSMLETLYNQYHLTCRDVDIDVIRNLSSQLRPWKWHCTASVRGEELIAIGPWRSKQFGLAVDLGTTKISGYLVDLDSGQTLASKGIMNPQISYGEDIISRIGGAAKSLATRRRLRRLVQVALNRLTQELCDEAGAKRGRIVEAVVVGNTAMHHLFIGLPVRQLALAPFVPSVSKALDIKARDLGLRIAPGAYVHVLPNIAAFVGADHVAMLLATEAEQVNKSVVAIDIGTNSEVSLIANGKITTVSCASGPAFEGYQIEHGMRAASGAIERVRVVKDSVEYQTIDEAPPIGICGSGIFDAMAQLYQAGVITGSGRMTASHPRVRTRNKQREFVLVADDEGNKQPSIVITQKDVRELQLAKAAIRTGIDVLLESNGRSEEDIDGVIIAGAFGSYIDVASAIMIGVLPSIPLDRFQQVGNAAGMGAKQALISVSRRAEAQRLASQVEYVELASAPNFMQTFIQAGYIGRYRMKHGEREEID